MAAVMKFLKRAPTFVHSVYVTEWLKTGKHVFVSDTVAFGDASPENVFSVPANTLIESVSVRVTTAFNGLLPTVQLGVSGTAGRHVATNDVDLTATGFSAPIIKPFLYTADAVLIATINAGAAGGSTGALQFWITFRPNTLSLGA